VTMIRKTPIPYAPQPTRRRYGGCSRAWQAFPGCPVRKQIRLLCLAIFSLLLAGCHPCSQRSHSVAWPTVPRLGIFRKPLPPPFVELQKFSLFVAPEFSARSPRRVLLVPTGTESGRYQVPSHFAEALAGAIRAAGVAEVVFPPQLDCLMTVDRLLTGQFDEADIVLLANTWQCDGIMFVRVNQVQSFSPLKASVTAALVDANESMVVFAVDGNWDTTDPEIRTGFEHFLKLTAFECSAADLRLQAQSPSRLFAYVAQQITTAWQQAQ
jgi:hypothetical protein